jgi:5-formyltetrahydrofolate cyclo-ligase
MVGSVFMSSVRPYCRASAWWCDQIMKVSKNAIRQELRELRRRLPGNVVEAAGERVREAIRSFAGYCQAASVVLYASDENEISLAPLCEQIFASGRVLYLPKTRDASGVVAWRPGQPLERGLGGVLEPLCGDLVQPRLPAIVLAPLVAWDTNGARLGRGAGFYDRLLPTLGHEVCRVGIAYEFQHWPGLPSDHWDVPLHGVITEQRRVDFAATIDSSEFRKGGAHT